MKKLRKLRKGLSIILSAAMVAGMLPGMGSIKVSAEEVTGGSVVAGDEETAAGYDANGFCTSGAFELRCYCK